MWLKSQQTKIKLLSRRIRSSQTVLFLLRRCLDNRHAVFEEYELRNISTLREKFFFKVFDFFLNIIHERAHEKLPVYIERDTTKHIDATMTLDVLKYISVHTEIRRSYSVITVVCHDVNNSCVGYHAVNNYCVDLRAVSEK